jgi:hypothetical protein
MAKRSVLTSMVSVLAMATGGMSALPAGAAPQPAPTCQLDNGIKHVIQIQFDNVHLTRDNPNVPSDLEQMPHLFNFLKRDGVVLANTHDDLVHTATNFVSNQTGLYPDRTAVTQSNSFNYYTPTGTTRSGVSFAYWTDPLFDPSGTSTDPRFNIDYTANRADVPNSKDVNAPAPWVPYTRAGCNVGDVGMANTVLENISTDIPTVFGPNSPQAAEAASDPVKATADVVGVAVHCASGSPTCTKGQTDRLPDEPGGYAGHKALFGNAEVQPAVSPSGPVKALDGTPIADADGNVGFPGFDSLTPNNSLGYAATLLEHNVPVVDAYISDVHGDHTAADTGDLGPGEKVYEQQLHEYDTAFAAFIARLARDGITPANTVFSVTTDEGDHFSGSAPMPAGCTGLKGNFCSYTTRSEVNVNLPGLLATKDGDTTPFAIHSDPAPALWLQGNPARTAAPVRRLERNMSRLTVANPLTGATDKVADQLADPVEEKILHFVSSDAARTPTLTAFSGEDEFVAGGAANCSQPCVSTSQGFAWNHGGLWPDMQDIWSAYVGPGIHARGVDTKTFADQTDTRPTLLALTGLRDDYNVDGRVLVELLTHRALSHAVRGTRHRVVALGTAYKRILAPTGRFADATLAASTAALASGTPGSDRVYRHIEAALTHLDNARNALAERIGPALLAATFHNRPIAARRGHALLRRARALIAAANALARAHTP